MSKSKLGIVILNYNTWNLTEKCIRNLKKQLMDMTYQFYIVDNHSSLQLPAKLKETFRQEGICLIHAIKNRGYSAGNNLGIKAALDDDCTAILISNNDVIYKKNCISLLITTLDTNDAVGIVGPNILNTDGTRQWGTMFTTTGLKEKYLARSILSILSKHFQKRYFGIDKNLSRNEEVAAIAGCCFIMDRPCAIQVYPFDENTFLYEEELILAWSMKKHNKKTILVSGAEVIHIGGATTEQQKALSFIHFVNSEIYYCKTYLDAWLIQLLPLYIIRTISYLYRMIPSNDFRINFIKYLKETMKRLWTKDGLPKKHSSDRR